ncbi:centrosomal protein POC5-like [Branchiostoma lanceolatum]|uniref:centrosomal protein POC5-like n=1 Tax=Branchiostoma lanceolatum TaxID=7740 RepID=UPI003456168E
MSSSSDDSNFPSVLSDSPGSSVSTGMQEEYEELLRYAVVTPKIDPSLLPRPIEEISGIEDERSEVNTGTQAGLYDESSVTTESSEEATARRVEEMKALRREDLTVPKPGAPLPQRPTSLPAFLSSPGATPGQPRMSAITPGLSIRSTEVAPPETPQSGDSSTVSEGSPYSERSAPSPSVDQDVARIEAHLDNWALDLKRGILAEFTQAKIALIERHRQEMRAEKERHAREVNQLQNEIESLKELMHTYEQSIERKDQVISNLTQALQRQKEKFDMLRAMVQWKLRHADERREAFASNLARKHYEQKISSRVWAAWHGVIEAKWRQRVERACQAKAQEVCMQLTNDYEARISSLNEALEAARTEVTRLHGERDQYEETMKKAFMRGVCALNLEAMSMFHQGEQGGRPGETQDEEGGTVVPHEEVYQSGPPQPAPPHVVTSQHPPPKPSVSFSTARPAAKTVPRSSAAQKSGSRTITAKVTAKQEGARLGQAGKGPASVAMGLAPPMSSVMVERHHPVTQQTIGHATAARYPRMPSQSQQPLQQSQPGILQRKVAGQTGKVHLGTPNVHSVKVVQ